MSYQLTKEQAYLAYTTYEGASVSAPAPVSFDAFSDEQFATWQKVGVVFYSFWAVPQQCCAA